MDYLCLLVALLLPWLGGYLWLAAIERFFASVKPNAIRQIGYGLFLGYAGMQGVALASNALFAKVSFWPLLLVVALLTLLGGILLMATRHRSARTSTLISQTLLSPRASRVLFWLFLAWGCLHLLLVAIEISHRPVFPWDAWLNWTYRAKAWFFSGQILAMDLPTQWLQGSISATYNVAGNHYPTFASVMAMWSAMALGHWSETLVNLPVLLCGAALTMGLFGQCRELAMPGWLSALCAYLLLSIPLLGAHLSLAGQADIWMAGFTGLGFVALISGNVTGRGFQVILGLTLVALGIAVKLEGAVWFLAAILTLALARYPALILTGLAISAAIAAICWLMGLTYVELPVLGGAGISDGRLHVPLLGNYELKTFDLWDDYRENLFINGTWHLLWTLTLLGVVSLLLIPAGVLRRTLLAFYSVLLATQLFIFEGTESGQWADDWTAINRLPLHFTPALVLSLGLLLQGLMPREEFRRPLGRPMGSALAALLLVAGLCVLYLGAANPSSNARPVRFNPGDLSIVVGAGQVADNIGRIEHYRDGIAIVSSGPIQLSAAQMPLLQLVVAGQSRTPYKFFWRTGNAAQDLHSTALTVRGTHILNLGAIEQWRDQVNEVGMIFYEDPSAAVEFGALEFRSDSLTWQLRKLFQDWAETTYWSQRSVNWLPAGAANSVISLPLAMGAWVLVTLLLGLLLIRRRQGILASVLLSALAAWVLLDIRWTLNGLAQAQQTMRTYPLLSANALSFGEDRFTHQLVEQARSQISKSPGRSIFVAESGSQEFQLLRAKYHALPVPVYTHRGATEKLPAEIADHILMLKKRYAQPGSPRPEAAAYAREIAGNTGLVVESVWDTPAGFLLSVNSDANSSQPVKQD